MLTVAFITCNRKDQFAKAVVSCEQHIKNIQWQLVVVDNHSTDGTKEWTEKHFQSNPSKLKYLYMEDNLGVAGARNVAYTEADGDIVYFLDDDAIIDGYDDCLDRAYSYMQKHREFALMGTDIYDHKINGPLNSIPQKGNSLKTGTHTIGFVGASHFINKSILGDIVLYPSFIFYGGEEFYLSMTTYNKDFDCGFYDGYTVHHYPSMKTRLSDVEIKMSLYCNAYRVRAALFPKEYKSLIKLFYYINIIRAFSFDIKIIKECNRRIKSSDYDDNKISKRTIRRLVKLFGVINVFK